MSKNNLPTVDEAQGLAELLRTIRAETVPLPEHTDPGAISDCWMEATERADVLISDAARLRERVRELEAALQGIYDDLIEEYSARGQVYTDGEPLQAALKSAIKRVRKAARVGVS